MTETILRAEEIPDSARRLRIVSAVVSTLLLAASE